MSDRKWSRLDAIADRHEAEKVKAKARAAGKRAAAVNAFDDRKAERLRWSQWMANGAFMRRHQSLRWNVAGRCERPVTVLRTVRNPAGTQSMLSELEVKCRKCQRCLAARAGHWRARARHELSMAVLNGMRTWFATLTLTPHEHFMVRSRCRQKAAKSGTDFDRLSEKEQFERLARQGGALVTLFLKRLRKNTGVGIRYLLVVEAHQSGLPHWHMLVHELDGPITKRQLEAEWKHGFSQFRLVDDGPKAAYYVTKYIAKSALARVRASGAYGKSSSDIGLTNHNPCSIDPTSTLPVGPKAPGAGGAPPSQPYACGGLFGGTCLPATGGKTSGGARGAPGLSEGACAYKSAATEPG